MMNSNQIGIDYNGVTVMKYGPPASFSFNSFVKFTITVTEKNVILDNGGYDQWVPIPGTVSSKENVIYMSSRVFDARHVSAMGTIRNILFEGENYFSCVYPGCRYHVISFLCFTRFAYNVCMCV
jgi:hypothetical protein